MSIIIFLLFPARTPTHINVLHTLHNVSANLSWFLFLVPHPPLLPELALSHTGINRLLLLPEFTACVQVGNATQNQVCYFDPLLCAALHQI